MTTNNILKVFTLATRIVLFPILGIWLVLFMVLAYLHWFVWDAPHPADLLLSCDVRYHKTTAWYAGLGTEGWAELQRSEISVRPESPDNGVLLLTRGVVDREFQGEAREWKPKSWNRVGVVYRYDPANDEINPVPATAWDQACGPIQACQFGLASNLRTDGRAGKLRIKGQPIDFAGWYLVSATASPSGRKAAILSLAGIRGPNLSFVVPAPDPEWGQLYHQVYSLEKDRFVSEPVRMPSRRNEFGRVRPFVCWTEDERYVIYHHPLLAISIIPVKSNE